MRSSYHSVNRWLRNTSDPDDSVHSSLHFAAASLLVLLLIND